MSCGRGKIHLAETGFKQTRWGSASIKIENENHVVITWYFQVRERSLS
jgi:hypothetical protein